MSESRGRPVILAGDMIALLRADPVVVTASVRGAPAALHMVGARALAGSLDLFRLVPTADLWRLDRQTDDRWHRVDGFSNLSEFHGRITDLGGIGSIAVIGNAAHRLLIDIHGGLAETPMGLTYPLPTVAVPQPADAPELASGIAGNARLMTPDGPKTAAALQVGDLLLDRRGRAIAISGLSSGTAPTVCVSAERVPDAFGTSAIRCGTEARVVIRSSAAQAHFSIAELCVPARLLAGLLGGAQSTTEVVAIELAESAVIATTGIELVLPGQARTQLPRFAQGRRALRVIGDHARTGLPMLEPEHLAKAAE